MGGEAPVAAARAVTGYAMADAWEALRRRPVDGGPPEATRPTTQRPHPPHDPAIGSGRFYDTERSYPTKTGEAGTALVPRRDSRWDLSHGKTLTPSSMGPAFGLQYGADMVEPASIQTEFAGFPTLMILRDHFLSHGSEPFLSRADRFHDKDQGLIYIVQYRTSHISSSDDLVISTRAGSNQAHGW